MWWKWWFGISKRINEQIITARARLLLQYYQQYSRTQFYSAACWRQDLIIGSGYSSFISRLASRVRACVAGSLHAHECPGPAVPLLLQVALPSAQPYLPNNTHHVNCSSNNYIQLSSIMLDVVSQRHHDNELAGWLTWEHQALPGILSSGRPSQPAMRTWSTRPG